MLRRSPYRSIAVQWPVSKLKCRDQKDETSAAEASMPNPVCAARHLLRVMSLGAISVYDSSSENTVCAAGQVYRGSHAVHKENEASTFLSRRSLLNRAWQATSFIPSKSTSFSSYYPLGHILVSSVDLTLTSGYLAHRSNPSSTVFNMQQFALLCVLAAMLPAQLVLAQHRGNFGGDNFRGGNFRGGPGGQVGGGPGGQFGGGTPNTFITIASAAPAAAATDSSPAAPAASAPAPASGGSSSSSSSSGGVSASLIPSFGITAGVSLNDGTPRCAGVDGKAIDCDCPPTLATFLAGVETDVASGADFPTGRSCPWMVKATYADLYDREFGS